MKSERQLRTARPGVNTLGTPALDGACPSLLSPPAGVPTFYLIFKEGLHSELEVVSDPFSILPDIEDQQAANRDHAGGYSQLKRGHAYVDLGCWGWRGL